MKIKLYYGALRFGPDLENFIPISGPRPKAVIIREVRQAFLAGGYEEEEVLGYLLRKAPTPANVTAESPDVVAILKLEAEGVPRCLSCRARLRIDQARASIMPMRGQVVEKKELERQKKLALDAMQKGESAPDKTLVLIMCGTCGQVHAQLPNGLTVLEAKEIQRLPPDLQESIRASQERVQSALDKSSLN